MTDMEGRVALVTGGARGIGRETALELARRGAQVAVADRKAGLASETAEECGEITAGAIALEYDQASEQSVRAMVDQAAKALGRIDLLFANAGTGQFVPLVDMEGSDWDRLIQINLSGTFYVCREVARRMIEQARGGRMVLTASSGAKVIANQLGAYCTTKAGVLMMMRHLASELGNYRIGVNAICPGVIGTDMTGPMLGEQHWKNMLRRRTPAGRWGTPEEVARLVAFLLSDEATYINGEDVLIDGGSTLHAVPAWHSLDYSKEQMIDWTEAFTAYPYA